MEEIVWKIGRQSRDLQELRSSLRGVWDDDTAREINQRYLEPQQDDAQRMHTALHKQQQALSEADQRVERTVEHGRHAVENAEQMNKSLNSAARETREVHASYEMSVQQHTLAVELLPQIHEMIQSANMAC